MSLLKKVKINNNSRVLYFNNIPLIYYEYGDNKNIKKCKLFPFLYKKHYESEIIYYLKVNILQEYTFISLQHWIDIIKKANADFYIICDNKKLEKEIRKRINFYNDDIKFIKSCKNTVMRKLIKKLSCTYWKNAAFAHLTTFYHASKHNIKNFWNIDADDTTILLSPQRAYELIKKAEDYSYKNNINIFSLDMHLSKCGGHEKMWTLGITFLHSDKNWLDIFNVVKDSSWLKYCGLNAGEGSADGFINYIGHNIKGINLKTFYNNNLHFIHWKYLYGFMFYFWKNGKINFPFLKYFNIDKISSFDIAPQCIDLELDIAEDEWKKTMTDTVLNIQKLENYINHCNELIKKEV